MAQQPDWMIGWEDVDARDYQGQDVPDIALDPNDNSLSLCNIHATTRVCYVTVYEAKVQDRHGNVLQQATTTDNDGNKQECVTFIVLCPPHTFAHLCYLSVPQDKSLLDIQIESDVQDWNKHPSPNDTHPLRLGFPLQGGGPFLCTQGESGELTHFFSGNLHAIDFRCDIGTPVLAVEKGTVVHVQDNNTLSGIAVSNLFKWNSILVEIDTESKESGGGSLFVEYVHIQENSATVKPGDVVEKGQVLCFSGSVGFSPEPHLHFCAYRTKDPTAPTVRVKFTSGETVFLPKAGGWYDANGPVEREAAT